MILHGKSTPTLTSHAQAAALAFVLGCALSIMLAGCGSGDAASTAAQTQPTRAPELRIASQPRSPAEATATTMPASATPTAAPTSTTVVAAQLIATAIPVLEPTVAPPPPAPTPTSTPVPPAAVPPALAPPPLPPPPPPPEGALAGIRIWSDGDSTSYFMSASLLGMAASLGGVPVQPVPEYKVSSGLMNPSFFDWPSYVSAQFAAMQPAVAVFMIGANDASSSLPYDVYHERVGALMDQMQAPYRRVIWVGQPHMGRPDLEPVIPDMNRIFSEEAAKRPWVTYVDIYSITSAADGSYSAYLPGADGVVELLRASDGVHFTAAGGRLLAVHVLDAILRR